MPATRDGKTWRCQFYYEDCPSLGFSTRFFQNYILIDVIQVSINAGFFCCLKI